MNHKNLFYAFFDRLRVASGSWMLAICWILGLLLGAIYGYRADPSYIHLMRMASSSRTSIVGLILVLYFPLLLSAFAVYSGRPQWLLPICFLKTFIFASCGSSLLTVFGSATWLVRMLLQFTDVCTLPFLLWFCLRNITGYNANTRFDFLVCLVAMTILGTLDFCVISPFLASLI